MRSFKEPSSVGMLRSPSFASNHVRRKLSKAMPIWLQKCPLIFRIVRMLQEYLRITLSRAEYPKLFFIHPLIKRLLCVPCRPLSNSSFMQQPPPLFPLLFLTVSRYVRDIKVAYILIQSLLTSNRKCTLKDYLLCGVVKRAKMYRDT